MRRQDPSTCSPGSIDVSRGSDEDEVGDRAVDELLLREPGELLNAAVRVEDAAVDRRDDEALRGGLEEPLGIEQALERVERGAGRVLAADVDRQG